VKKTSRIEFFCVFSLSRLRNEILDLLIKPQAIVEAAKRKLDTTGIIDDIRRRLNL